MKLICLLSSGIDSPVAAYLMLKQGAEVVFAHVSTKQEDAVSIGKTKKLIQKISKETGKELKLITLPHELDFEIPKSDMDRRYTCQLCKRFMYRLAEQIAKKEKAEGILTGENLGQVASQTLDNILAQEKIVEIPVIRPLIGLDKKDIIDIAKQAGTYDLSIVSEKSCPVLPPNPATRANDKKVDLQESKFDIEALLNKSFSKSEVNIIKPM
ncbi:MAG: 7-cyano-7-deazaguanine synthase [Candidatus Diapherotrites archaeon]|nr:7-cyano-7-deazaguanine synthase [Candidatus Diapherotrites archaeon]